MNKVDLINVVALKTGLTKQKTNEIVSAFLDTITDYLEIESQKKSGQRKSLQLMGFGSFVVRDRKARKGFNPLTRSEIQIPKKTVPSFRASENLKAKIVFDGR